MTLTAPRIEPLSPDDPVAQQMTIGSDRNGGRPLNIFLTLAKHPEMYEAFGRLGSYLLFKGVLPAREREIVILRVGWRSQSEYEFGQHTVIGEGAGLSAEEISRLTQQSVEGWTDDDAALVQLADDLCVNDVVADGTWDILRRRWSEEELLELLTLAGFYRLVSGVLNSAGVALEPSTPGWPAGGDGLRRAPRESGR